MLTWQKYNFAPYTYCVECQQYAKFYHQVEMSEDLRAVFLCDDKKRRYRVSFQLMLFLLFKVSEIRSYFLATS